MSFVVGQLSYKSLSVHQITLTYTCYYVNAEGYVWDEAYVLYV